MARPLEHNLGYIGPTFYDSIFNSLSLIIHPNLEASGSSLPNVWRWYK